MLRRMLVTAALAAALPALAFAQAAQAPPQFQPAHIEPANELERTFIRALTEEAQRPVFRQQFLNARVVIAMVSNAPDARPFEFPTSPTASAGAVFTSAARLDSILGPSAPRRIVTGREALTLLRGKNVAVNPRLSPMLTLEAADVASWLATPAQ